MRTTIRIEAIFAVGFALLFVIPPPLTAENHYIVVDGQIVVKRTAGHDLTMTENFKSPYDHLIGLKQRHSLPKFSEPQVALIFDSYGGVDKAYKYLRTATRENPDDMANFNDLGNLWRVKGETFLAAECFRKVLSIDPQNTDALLNLACILQNVGYHLDAEGLLRIALEIVPNSVLHHFTLGNVLMAQQQPDAAAQSFQTALAIEPNFPLAQNSLVDMISQGWLPPIDGYQHQPLGLVGHQRKALPVDPVHLVQGMPASAGIQDLNTMDAIGRHHARSPPPPVSYGTQVFEMIVSHFVPIIVSIFIVLSLAAWNEQQAQEHSKARKEVAAQEAVAVPANSGGRKPGGSGAPGKKRR